LSGHRGSLIGNKVLEALRGDVLTVKLAHNLLDAGGGSLSMMSMFIGVDVGIIIRETLINDILEGLAALENLLLVNGLLLGLASDHHGDGDVVVVGGVLLFISVLLEDRVESIVPDDLPEGLQSNGLHVIESVGGAHLHSNSLHLVDGHLHHLSLLVDILLVSGLGVSEDLGGRGLICRLLVQVEEALDGVVQLLVQLGFLLLLGDSSGVLGGLLLDADEGLGIGLLLVVVAHELVGNLGLNLG